MNIDRAKQLECWLAQQFKDMPGGYEAACSWPDAPIKKETLSLIGRGLRRLRTGDLLWLCAINDRPDLLRAVADLIDEQKGPGSIAKLAHKDVYDSADLARRIDEAEEDGRYTSAEIHEIKALASQNASNAAEVLERAQRLAAGPIEPED